MTSGTAIRTNWTKTLNADEPACPAALRDHLIEVHRQHPGFTEGCAAKCKDDRGRTSYQWLCDVVDPVRHDHILDLACGSGVLLDLCRTRHLDAGSITGVDMSAAELALAAKRLIGKNIILHEGFAQDLRFLKSSSIDAVLCHWALTLMAPIEPVLHEIDRVLSAEGVFAAIVDGNPALAPGYGAIDDLVFDYVRREVPAYGERDLGDPRTRNPQALAALAREVFTAAQISVEDSVFTLKGEPVELAREAVGFFYAAFVLPEDARSRLLIELADIFENEAENGIAQFSMPVCRLLVQR